MAITVAKFGGSSLCDARQFERVRAIIRADPRRRYIVVSAPGKRFSGDEKITDLLCRAADGRVYPAKVEERFCAIRDALGIRYPVEERLAAVWRRFLRTGEPAPLIGCGEFFCARLLAAYCGLPFLDARRGIEIGDDGRADDEKTRARLQRALAGVERAVIPGFYGRGPDGKTRLFSRGGSDISGALVARAVGADLYENWTDVSGFFNADPRCFPAARPIAAMSYGEMRLLSHLGATVLHEDAVFPVREAGIPIAVRNTNRPDDPGTWITRRKGKDSGEADAVTVCDGYTAICSEDLTNEQEKDLFAVCEQAFLQENGRYLLVIQTEKLTKIAIKYAADKKERQWERPVCLIGVTRGGRDGFSAAVKRLDARSVPVLFGDAGLSGDVGYVLGVAPEDAQRAAQILLTT